MNIQTFFHYLFGDRGAILKVAASRHSIWLGLVFVVSAGLAREYDSVNLWREPTHLLLPLFASIMAALCLYLLLCFVGWMRRAERPPFFSGLETFVRLFWMTAPLAWLYAIPFETFLSPADAMRANLGLLGLVSTWRVLLMTRVVSVLFDVSWLAAFAVVMLFADTLLLGAFLASPEPIIHTMGGISLSESDQVLADVTHAVTWVAAVFWPLWFLLALAAVFKHPWDAAFPANGDKNPIRLDLWLLGGASVLVWAIILPFT